MVSKLFILSCVSALGLACGDDNLPTAVNPIGTADLTGPSGVNGAAAFTLNGNLVSIAVTLEGVSPPSANHGIHIHETGLCEGDFTSAGGHWNPGGDAHGQPGEGHLGDLGNVIIDASGNGSISFSHPGWTLGNGASSDVVDQAIVLHQNPDDYSQPLGNAGPPIACGVIELLSP